MFELSGMRQAAYSFYFQSYNFLFFKKKKFLLLFKNLLMLSCHLYAQKTSEIRLSGRLFVLKYQKRFSVLEGYYYLKRQLVKLEAIVLRLKAEATKAAIVRKATFSGCTLVNLF